MYKIVIKVDGMNCGMCESHLNDVIRKNFKVKKVNSSHSKNEVVIISNEILDEQIVKEVIYFTGYNVKDYNVCEHEGFSLFKRKK